MTLGQTGRCVRKGERGLRILAPMSVTEVDEATGEEVKRPFFREAAVFDVSQTEPLPGCEPVPLSPPGGEIEGDSHAKLVPALEALAGEIGYAVAYSDELEPRRGCATGGIGGSRSAPQWPQTARPRS